LAKKPSTTPKGRLVYPRVSGKPDTKFKAEGQWKTGLSLPLAPAKPLMKEIDAAIKTAFEEAKKTAKNPKAVKLCADKPYKVETDEEGNETGNVIFNFKMTASGISKKTGKPFTMAPKLFDAEAQVLPQDTRIGGGTLARISYEISPFAQAAIGVGVSLRLSAVQVIELVEWGGDGTSYGFQNEAEDDEDSEDAVEEAESEDEESTESADAF
jgi:hypothetical protein